jgi:exopolysaccharide biosynthesis polyprenyl glycosylphosphotransferase
MDDDRRKGGNQLTQTSSRTRTWVGGRRRGGSRDGGHADVDLHADISPVWEVLPRGHQEVGARPAVLQRDSLLRRGLGLVDLVAAFVALLAVVNIIDAGRISLKPGAVLIVPFVLLAGKVIGLYDRDQHVLRKTTIDEAPSIFYLAVLYSLSVWLCEAVFFHGLLQRAQVFGLLLSTFVLTAVGRLIVRKAAYALTPSERCIVIGNATDATRIASKFTDAHSVNATILGRVALHGKEVDDTSPVVKLGEYTALAQIVAEYDVERAIIAPASDGQEEILDAIRLIKALGVKVSVLPRLLEVVGSTSTFDDVDGMWLLGVRQYGLARSSEMLKRSMDIVAAGLGLVVLGPLFLMLTLAVKLDSRGPVFFRQRRIGRRGETIWMLKFRSMVDGAEDMKDQVRSLNEAEGGLFKIGADPRITRVGGFFRRTSLDELPQLINVLRGDMSLVGPRPLVPDEDALIEGWQRRRLAVKPGMTGLWQIFGSSRIPMHEMVKIDYIYGANWSLWLDLRILLRTIPYVLSRRGL